MLSERYSGVEPGTRVGCYQGLLCVSTFKGMLDSHSLFVRLSAWNATCQILIKIPALLFPQVSVHLSMKPGDGATKSE